jgi:hypothetical protein
MRTVQEPKDHTPSTIINKALCHFVISAFPCTKIQLIFLKPLKYNLANLGLLPLSPDRNEPSCCIAARISPLLEFLHFDITFAFFGANQEMEV